MFVFAIYFKTNIQNFFVLVYFVCHTPQFKMLVFAFKSEIWIAQNLNFTAFEDFCLSLSWQYRFSQNVNHTKVQSKTNKYYKFHVDLTRRRLPKRQFKKLGMVPKKLYRNTLKLHVPWVGWVLKQFPAPTNVAASYYRHQGTRRFMG